MTTDTLTALDAHALSDAIHRRTVSCREVMTAYLARIAWLNPQHTAIVAQAPDDTLLAQADACDAELAAGHSRGWLHGQPAAIKDTGQATGFATSFGSPLLARQSAREDSIYVARMKAAGALVIGKTNMSEFGLGSHSYNRLYGTTRNAWDRTVTAGGSSGGAAVALALRLLPVADGSDFMGSLRNPAGWNHVYGLRPSQGRVPSWPRPDLFVSQLGIDGPMARTVRDLARLLETQAGYDARTPLALGDAPGTPMVPPPQAWGSGLAGKRIAWLGDLGGHLAVEPGILPLCESALARMAEAGAVVEPATLDTDLDAVWNAWLAWRCALVAPMIGQALQLPGAREQIKPEALWEYERAQGLQLNDFMRAAQVRSAFYTRLATLLEHYDALALPVAQAWPFDANLHWPKTVAGRAMDTYHRWMECTLYATFAGLPAISLPAGFSPDGRLPMGIQLIGRPRGDAALLALAAGYEARVHDLLARRPPEAS
ncbi:MAG: amidase [Burkholderiaceae bacterium]|nr:amidase [Burkholderiaceae bacterium]